jgi:predicted XRE-type DNA-binding protein
MRSSSRGSWKVIADLGDAGAKEGQTKLPLKQAVNGVIARRRLPQKTDVDQLGIGQPKVSALLNYKRDCFSVECLMTLLTSPDHDAEFILRTESRSRSASRNSVATAAKGRRA